MLEVCSCRIHDCLVDPLAERGFFGLVLTRNWDAQVMTEDLVSGAGGAEARRYEKRRGRPDGQRLSQNEGLSKSGEYEVGGFTELLPSLFARSSSGAT